MMKTSRFTQRPWRSSRSSRVHPLSDSFKSLSISLWAIDVMNDRKKLYVIEIEIGSQDGGMCSKLGIKEEEFVWKWECLFFSLQALTELTLCNIFLNEDTVAAVGNSSIGLRLFGQLWKATLLKICVLQPLSRGSQIIYKGLW